MSNVLKNLHEYAKCGLATNSRDTELADKWVEEIEQENAQLRAEAARLRERIADLEGAMQATFEAQEEKR